MPMPPEEPPTIVKQDERETVFAHPAFGQISVNRSSGGRRVLYDSDFIHDTVVTVRITPSERHRSLSHFDCYDVNRPIIEIEMSEAQWATFVSSFSVGGGVPCTITRLNNQPVPRIPYESETDYYRQEITATLERTLKELVGLREKIEAGVQGLTRARAAEMLGAINAAISNMNDSLPFIAKSYAEYMERVREKAKIEIHAHASNFLRQSGLAALAKQTGEAVPMLSLGAHLDAE